MQEQTFDILGISEVDIEYFDEMKPYSIKGYKTFFPLPRPGTSTKRLLCFVKDSIEVTQRTDLMSEFLSTVWLEVRTKSQKILINVTYREFSDLTKKGQLTINEQIERLKILHLQLQKASKEGLIVILGDMNINLEQWEDSTYYLKKIAEEYQLLIGQCGLELLDFGITWSRNHKNGKVVKSAIDHALTNKPMSIKKYFKSEISYSDHSLICVDLRVHVAKTHKDTTISRDYRKLRSNPLFFLNGLAKIKWELPVYMEDIDDMEQFWSAHINECLDFAAPWKSKKFKLKRYQLPKEVQSEVLKQKELSKRHKMNIHNGQVDAELESQYKKHRNYCNKLIKKAVKEKNGENITNMSNVKQVWSSLNSILKPENCARKSIKIQVDNNIIKDPQLLAEEFNAYFNKKIENLVEGIKKKPNEDPFIQLNEKMTDSNLKFKLKTVSEYEVMKILKSLKTKQSFGCDGITLEILKLGVNVLVVPLTYIVNYSILTGKYPSRWKISKIFPLHKKGDRGSLKN